MICKTLNTFPQLFGVWGKLVAGMSAEKIERKNENSTSPKEKVKERKLTINGKEYTVKVGINVPVGFWGWIHLKDEELNAIVNGFLNTLRKKPLIAKTRLYYYAERYLKEPFEKDPNFKDDLTEFIDELIKNKEFAKALKEFNARGNTDWIENYKNRKFHQGLGAITNMLEKLVDGLLKLGVIRRVPVKIGDEIKNYFVPADMKLEEVYNILGLTPPGKEPEKMKKADIMEKLVELAKKIAASRDYGVYLLQKWSSIIGKKEAEREAERLRKRLYFGKRLVIAMLNEIGIRANNRNYSKYVDILSLNLRLKNEGLPIDPKALSIALQRTKKARGIEEERVIEKEKIEAPKVEVVTRITPTVTSTPKVEETKRKQLTLEESLKIDFSNPFAVFYQIGRFGLEVQNKLKELDEVITQLAESKLDKVAFQETLEELKNKINNALEELKNNILKKLDEKTSELDSRIKTLENNIPKLIERIDVVEKRLENGFIKTNKAFGKLQTDVENAMKYLTNEFNKLRRQVIEVQRTLDELTNTIANIIKEQAISIITTLFEELGKGIKKKIEEFEKSKKELEKKVNEALKRTPPGLEKRVKELERREQIAKARELILLLLIRRGHVEYEKVLQIKFAKEALKELEKEKIVRVTLRGFARKRKVVELVI